MSSYLYLEKRKRRGEILTEMRAIAKKGKDATEADDLKFAELKTELDIVNADIRQMAIDLEERNDHADSYVKPEERSIIGQTFRALHNPKAENISQEVRAITSSGASAIINDPVISNEIILKLANYNPLQELGARFVNVENNTQWGRVANFPTAYWTAEGSEITVDSAMTIESKKIDMQNLSVRVRVSNQVLRDSSGRAERMIEEAALLALDEAIQTAIYHGTGTNQPTGIIKLDETVLSGVNEVDNAGAAFDYDTFANVFKVLMNNNVPLNRIGVVTNPVVWYNVSVLKASDNQYIIPPLDLNKPGWKFTPAISTTFDSSTSTCAIIGDFSTIVVGLSPTFEITCDQTRAAYLETEYIISVGVDYIVTNPSSLAALHSLPLT